MELDEGTTTPAPRVVDLFAGAGGLSVGLRSAGYRVLAGSDNDPDAMATFSLNFPEATTITGDIRQAEVKRQIVEIGASADVVVGGPPCQAFSQVRNHSRLIDDPRNSLYREFVHVVGRIEPRAFLMENVQGMSQMGVKEQVLHDLSQRGQYRVVARLVDAADFGVPQTRKRLIFIGIHRDLGVEPPEVEGSGASAALTLLPDSERRRGYRLGLRTDVIAEELLHRLQDPSDVGIVSAEQAIGDLSFLEAGHRKDALDSRDLGAVRSAYQRSMRVSGVVRNLGVPRMNVDTTMRLNGIPAGGNHRDLPDELRARYLTGQKWGPSTDSDRLARKHYYAYRRLHPDLWAWTLNTKADAVYHYHNARALSVREFCRLQSFPDDFVVTTDSRQGDIAGRVPNGATHSRYRQIGNAVPPLLARAIGAQLHSIIAPALSGASA
ncbi:DNA cytosine methyltransferase [Agromyces sp. Marseille-P2726]|uniref:DNA cytosine methyltransferase n=1 Tax=Agromyces sp. Marseille-P2726 TaxID=2709132 RepID=UPI001C2DB4DB|nr:DNA cytosine methyltransferase [Agromyces sp. Marseille-P2726]